MNNSVPRVTLKWRLIGFYRSVWWPVKIRFGRAYEPTERTRRFQREVGRATAADDLTLDEMKSLIHGVMPARFRDPPLGVCEVRKSPLLGELT